MEAVRVFLYIFVESRELDHVSSELSILPQVVDLYEVTGESDLVALVKIDSLSAFRNVLVHKILKIRGGRSTSSAIILHAHKEPRSRVEVNSHYLRRIFRDRLRSQLEFIA